MPECRTCLYEATRVYGELVECDACYKYRRRHDGQARPAKLIDRTGRLRSGKHALAAEREYLRRTGFFEKAEKYGPEYVTGVDGISREILRP